jgi:hypothetical protein
MKNGTHRGFQIAELINLPALQDAAHNFVRGPRMQKTRLDPVLAFDKTSRSDEAADAVRDASVEEHVAGDGNESGSRLKFFQFNCRIARPGPT